MKEKIAEIENNILYAKDRTEAILALIEQEQKAMVEALKEAKETIVWQHAILVQENLEGREKNSTISAAKTLAKIDAVLGGSHE